MKLTAIEKKNLFTRLNSLSVECEIMAIKSDFHVFLNKCYESDDSLDSVICYLQDVLCRAENLRDSLNCLEASLDSLLIKVKMFDDLGV